MKIDMLGFRVDEWEISNTDPDQTCAISPRQLVALLKALENACEDRNRPTQSSPLSSWLEGFEAGCELSRNRQGVSLSSLPPLLQAAAAFSPAEGLAPVQSDMPDSCPSVPEGSIASQTLSDSDQSSSDSSASSCVEADKARNTGDGIMPSPGITAGPDDFDAALAQRHGEKLEIVAGQGSVSGYCKKTEGVNGTDAVPQILANTAMLTRLSAPVTEEERAAFNALPAPSRADILGRMLDTMRVLYRTRPDGVYFSVVSPKIGFDPRTFCLTEGPNGERHTFPDYESPWEP